MEGAGLRFILMAFAGWWSDQLQEAIAPILRHEVRDRVPFPAVEPAGQSQQHELEAERSTTRRSLYHEEPKTRPEHVGRELGHNGFSSNTRAADTRF